MTFFLYRIHTNILRVYPIKKECHLNCCLRLELYGCSVGKSAYIPFQFHYVYYIMHELIILFVFNLKFLELFLFHFIITFKISTCLQQKKFILLDLLFRNKLSILWLRLEEGPCYQTLLPIEHKDNYLGWLVYRNILCAEKKNGILPLISCLLYTSPSPRDS